MVRKGVAVIFLPRVSLCLTTPETPTLEKHMQRTSAQVEHTRQQLVLLVSPSVQNLNVFPRVPGCSKPLEAEVLRNLIKCRADMTAGAFEGLDFCDEGLCFTMFKISFHYSHGFMVYFTVF